MSEKILYEGDAVDAVQRLLEKGRAYVDSDGYLSLLPGDTAAREAETQAAFDLGFRAAGGQILDVSPLLAAQGIEAPSGGKTGTGLTEGESPVAKPCAQNTPGEHP